MQTRRGSMIEALVNVLIGYSVAVTSQIVVFPLLDMEVPLSKNLLIGVIFTFISLVRSFTVRRVFTRYRLFRTKDRPIVIADEHTPRN